MVGHLRGVEAKDRSARKPTLGLIERAAAALTAERRKLARVRADK